MGARWNGSIGSTPSCLTKLGTLTLAQPHVGHIYTCGLYQAETILKYAATAEQKQPHPVARAILQAATERQVRLVHAETAVYQIGFGLTADIGRQRVHVGSLRFIEREGLAIPATIRHAQAECHSQGHSLVCVAIDGQLAGAIELQATIRPEAKRMIRVLRQHGIRSMAIISGDAEPPTQKLATELGIHQYYAETLPEDKAQLIAQLQKSGRSVCYIGDGINDALAMKQADVSISLRGASSVATDTAEVILMNESLSQLPELFRLSREYAPNMQLSAAAIVAPSLLGVGGALFLNFGLMYSAVLPQIALLLGTLNASRPLLAARQMAAQERSKRRGEEEEAGPTALVPEVLPASLEASPVKKDSACVIALEEIVSDPSVWTNEEIQHAFQARRSNARS